MSQRFSPAAVLGVFFLMLVVVDTSATAAEFRTTAHGRTVVRQASYEEPTETLTSPELSLEPTFMDPQADCVDPCWDSGCAPTHCDPCGVGCGYWGSFEFILWWRSSQDLPPLVTTSTTEAPIETAGVLGAADTDILYPTESQSGDARPGGRLTFGMWLDPYQCAGAGVRLFSLGDSTASFDVTSDTVPILARPFFNVSLGQQDAAVVAYPDFTTGGISTRNTSRIGGGDVFYRRLFYQDECRRVDLVAGFQFSRIDADLQINTNRRSIRQEGSIPFGTTITTQDLFDTENRYYAGEVGFLSEYDRGCITWTLLAKVGLGNMRQRTQISGGTVTAVPGQPVTTSEQGLLALGTNIGTYERKVFSVSPEVGLNLAYHLNDCVDLIAGYSLVYWNHVAQPDSAIDTSLNTTQITGPLVGLARPEFLQQDSSYFVQGLNFGVRWSW